MSAIRSGKKRSLKKSLNKGLEAAGKFLGKRNPTTLLALSGAVAGVVSLFQTHSAGAASYSWSVGTGTWSTTTNWSPTGTPLSASADSISFLSTATATIYLNGNQGSSSTAGLLTFGNTGTLTLAGGVSGTTATNTLYVSGITVNAGAGAVTIGGTGVVNLVAPSMSITNNSGNLLTLSKGLNSWGSSSVTTFTFAGGGNITASGVIGNGTGSNAVALVKSGSGTLTLSGANTFTGGLNINAGSTVTASSVGSLGTSTGGLVVNGQLNLSGGGSTAYSFGGPVSGNGTITITLGTGSNSVAVNNPTWSSFAGNIIVGTGSSGKVQLNSALPSTAKVNVAANGTLYVTAAVTDSAALTLNGGATGETLGQLRLENSTWAGSITLAGAMSSTNNGYVGGNSVNGYITGNIGESGGARTFSRSGSGTTITSGTNTYTGGTNVISGTLKFAKTSALPSTGTTTVTVNANAAVGYYVGGAGEFSNATSGAGSLGYAMSNTVFAGTGGSLVIDTSTAVSGVTYAGAIGAMTNNPNIYKQGSNTLTLSGALSYAGNTVVNGGTLALTNASNTFTGELIMQAGGVMNLASFADYGAGSSMGSRTAATDSTGNIGLHFTGGTLQYTGVGDQSTNRQIRVQSNTTNAIDSSGTGALNFTYSGTNYNFWDSATPRALTLTGSSTSANTFAINIQNYGAQATSLVKSGVGTWIVSNPHNSDGTTTANLTYGGFTGGTTVNGGTLIANAAGALGSGNITVSTGTLSLQAASAVSQGTITVQGTGQLTETVDNAISGSTALTLSGGTTTLSNANNYTGITAFNAATLILGDNNALGSTSQVSINGAGILQASAAVVIPSSIQFNFASNWTVSGSNSMTLNGQFANFSGNRVVTSSITGGGNALTLGGNVYLSESTSTARTLTFNGSGTTTITGVIANALGGAGQPGGLTYSGTGLLNIAGSANTYTGNTTVSSGTLNLGAASAVDAGTMIVSGGQLTETAANGLSGGALLTVSGGTATLTFANSFSGATSVSAGTLALNAAGAITGSAVTVSGTGQLTESVANALSGGTSLNVSAGTVILPVANDFSGATSVTGTLQLQDFGAIASSSGLTMNGGGTLQLRNNSSGTFSMPAVSPAVGGTSTIDVNNNGSGSGNELTLGNGISLASSGSTTTTTTVNFTGSNSYTLGVPTLALANNASTGSQTLGVVLNPTTAAVSIGTVTNSVTGANRDTKITLGGTATGNSIDTISPASGGGWVYVAQTGGGWTVGNINTGQGDVQVSGGTLTVSGTVSTAAANHYVAVSNANTLVTINSIGNTGGLTVGSGSTAVLTGAAGSWASGATVTGTLQVQNAASTGSGNVVLNSGSTLQLRNDNSTTFTLPVILTAGNPASATINVDDLTSSSGKLLTISSLSLSSGVTTTNTLNVTGANGYDLSIPTVNIANTSATNTTVKLTVNAVSADVTLGAVNGTTPASGGKDVYLVLGGGTTGNQVTGAMSQTGSSYLYLTKQDTGTWTLMSGSTYNGTTTVSGGILNIRANNALGSTTGGTTVTNTATLQIQGGVNYSTTETLSINGNGAAGATGALESVSGANTFAGAITLAAASTIAVDADSLTLKGAIGGGFNLTKVGAGTLTATNNTFTGVLTIKEGLFQSAAATAITTVSSIALGDSTNVSTTAATLEGINATQTITKAINVYGTNQVNTIRIGNFTQSYSGAITLNNADLTLNNGSFGVPVFSGGVSGTGDLTIANSGNVNSGSGTMTLQTGSVNNIGLVTNSGSGTVPTIVSAVIGSNVTGVVQNSSSSKLTLAGANTYSGSTTITLGTLQIGNGGTTGSLNPSSSITDNATLAFNRTNTITQGTDFASGISGTGVVTQAGSGVLVLNGTNTYQGGTNINAGVLQVDSAGALGTTGGIVFGGGTLRYTANNQTDYSSRFTAGTGRNYKVDVNGEDVTWSSALTSTNGLLIVNDTAGGGVLNLNNASDKFRAITLNGGATVNLVTDIVLSDSGSSPALNGTGGTINSSGGRIKIGASTADWYGGSVTPITVNAVIMDGTGNAIDFYNNGTLILKGNNTFTGQAGLYGTVVRIGVDSVGSVGSITSSAIGKGLLYVGSTAAFTSDGTSPRTLLNAVEFANNGTFGDATLNGKLTFAANVNLGNATRTITNKSDVEFSGVISSATATVGLTTSTTGTLTLSGLNTYSGPTSLNGGTLSVNTLDDGGSASSIGSSSNAAANLTINTATLRYTGGTVSTDRRFNLANGIFGIDVTNAATNLTFSDINGSTYNATPASIAISKSGPGTLTLNTTGTAPSINWLTVSGGTLTGNLPVTLVRGNTALTVNGGSTLSIGEITLSNANGHVSFDSNSANTIASNLVFAGGDRNIDVASGGTGTISGDISESGGSRGFTKTSDGTLVLAGTNSYSGATVISGGTLQVGGGSTSGTLGSGAVTNNAAMVFNRTDSYSGSVANAIDGTGTLTLTQGSLALSGTSTYSGNTVVNGGTLRVNGSLGNTAVAVNSGGTLGGTGTIAGAVTVNSGGHLAPGNSPGALVINNTLTLSSGSVSDFEIASTSSYDQVTGLTGLTYGGTLNVTGSIASTSHTYTLFSLSSGTPSGDFSSVNLATAPTGYRWHDFDAGAGVDYFNNASGTIQLEAISGAAVKLGLVANALSGSLRSDTTDENDENGMNAVGSIHVTGSNGRFVSEIDGLTNEAGVHDFADGYVQVDNDLSPAPTLVMLWLKDNDGVGGVSKSDVINSLVANAGGAYTVLTSSDEQWQKLAGAYSGFDTIIDFGSVMGTGDAFSWKFEGDYAAITVDKVAVVPEPGSLGLLGLGALGLMGSRRRKSKKVAAETALSRFYGRRQTA